MVFTAVLAAIAVIAAMVTVPGANAEAAEPTDFTPNSTLGNELKKEEKDPQHFAADYSWGLLVWAGEPAGPGFNNGGNKNNDVGWGWCIEPHAKTPLNTFEAYQKKNATKLEFDERYHDAVINLGRKMEAAAARGDKKAAANYYVYLLMFLDSHQNPKNLPFETIVGNSKDYFPGFTGSHEEFTALTGYKIEGPKEVPKLVKDPTVEIAKQPEDAFITVVHPNGNRNSKAQSVIPVDQPGLPDEPDNGGGSEEPTTSAEETSSDETTSENPGGETSPNETTENPEPSESEGTTPKGTTSETTPDKTTDVTPNPEPTPTTSEQEKGLEPKIETEASIKDGNRVEKGATVIDTVTYKDLVPGKEYTLKAELISKEDGKSVLGTGEKTFKPEASNGKVEVEITVNDDVTEPVEAAVAFEELTSVEVDKNGKETPDATSEKPNHIAEHKDINDKDQTVTSDEVDDQDNPGGSSNGSSKGKIPWWLILIPGIGLGKIIKDRHDHNDHGSHNGGHGDNTGNHNGGNGHEGKGQDAPQGGNSDNGHGRDAGRQGQQPEETGNALPSNADRVEIKSVPSGATELESGMQDYIK